MIITLEILVCFIFIIIPEVTYLSPLLIIYSTMVTLLIGSDFNYFLFFS